MNDELKDRFEAILNEQFQPNSETPLWACIALSSDKDAYFKAMLSAIELDRADGWVRVSERLPEIEVSVWIFTDLGYMGEGFMIKQDAWRLIGLGVADNITHWMPLPNKPNKQ